ncbi:MAG: aldo/keto reductase [Candidatus Brocadiae bacterium]|nr:aldo/keto reductase [Candidatus Brocadiia bacterium]
MPPTAPAAPDVFPICLGGNVFGWTADEAQSFAVLDAYAAAGGNFIDTADMYSAWVAGHDGGESEAIIGRWMEARGCRDRMVIATKVGQLRGLEGLSAATIRTAAEGSLRRLRTDRIDLYYAHRDDPGTPLPESLGAFDALVREGKVRRIAASNYTGARLAEALAVSDGGGLARFSAIQPHYNLVHRGEYEGELAGVCAREGMACHPYFALAKGFLTGKYRPGVAVDSPRSRGASQYLDARGMGILAAVEAVAALRGVAPAAVAIAWLRAQPTVVAPIASARTTAQLAEILPGAALRLEAGDLAALDAVSRPHGAQGAH